MPEQKKTPITAITANQIQKPSSLKGQLWSTPKDLVEQLRAEIPSPKPGLGVMCSLKYPLVFA